MSDSRTSRSRFVIGAGLTAAILTKTSPAFAQSQTFKLAHPDNNRHPAQRVAERFAADVAKRSNGRFKIDVYPAGTLGSEINIVSGLQTGTIDFAMHTSGYLESFVQTIQVLDLPFVFKDSSTAQKLLDGDVGKQLVADMLGRNIVHLAWGHYGWRQTETNEKVVREPADLRGVKIRIQAGPVFKATFEAVGAIPVVLDAQEVYLALSQKTVGGCEFPFLAYRSNKIYEVAKNVAKTFHVYNAGALMMSKPKFEALAPADQQMIRAAGAEQTPFWRSSVAQAEIDDEKFAENNGVRITNTNYAAFRAAMTPVYAEFKPKYTELLNKVLAAGA